MRQTRKFIKLNIAVLFFVMLMAFPFTVQAAKTYVPIKDKYVSVGDKMVALTDYNLFYTQAGTKKSIHNKVLSAITDGQNVYYSVELDNHLMQWNPVTGKSKAVAKLPVYSGNPWIELYCGYGNNLFFSSSTDNTYRYSLSKAKSYLVMKGVYVKEYYKNLMLLTPGEVLTGADCYICDMSTLGKTTVSKSQQGATFINGKVYYAEMALSGDAFKFTIKRYDPATKKTSTITNSFKGLIVGEINARSVTYYDINSDEHTVAFSDFPAAPVATIRLSNAKKSITVGLTCKLTAVVTGKSKKVTWRSSNKSVAVVNAKGVVTAKKAGKATITATANGKKATCIITVLKPTIKLNKTKATIYQKGKLTLNAAVTGKSKTVTWSTSNKKIATVKNGVVTGKGVGKAVITAKANGVSAKCTVTVRQKKSDTQSAAFKSFTSNSPVTIGSSVFSKAYNSSSGYYTIYVTKGGKRTALVSKAVGYTSVTNGSILYYSEGKSGQNSSYTIYKYNISSGAKERVVAGLRFEPIACEGDCLYYGSGMQYGGVVSPLRVINTKSKSTVSLNYDADNIQVINGKLLVSATGKPHGGPFFIMNKNGSGVKLITNQNVSAYRIKGNYIYFLEVTYYWDKRACRCDLNGNNYEILENWLDPGSRSGYF